MTHTDRGRTPKGPSNVCVSNPDDARGQIALGLFLYEAIDRDKKSTSESIYEALELVAPATLSIVYLAARQPPA